MWAVLDIDLTAVWDLLVKELSVDSIINTGKAQEIGSVKHSFLFDKFANLVIKDTTYL